MKKLSGFTLLICALLTVQFVHAQTVDEIINKNIEAMGGREKMLSLTSAYMTGTFTAAGAPSINILVSKKHLTGSRIDIEANGTNNYQLITPTNGWIFTPVQGDKEPRLLPEGIVRSGQVQLDLHGPFIGYKEKGIKIEMAGKDTIDGSICYKLKVNSPNGDETIYSIDSRSGFILRSSTKMFQYGAWEDVVTSYGDYHQNTDGYWFYYGFTNARGTTKYENIVVNIPVDDGRFKIK